MQGAITVSRITMPATYAIGRRYGSRTARHLVIGADSMMAMNIGMGRIQRTRKNVGPPTTLAAIRAPRNGFSTVNSAERIPCAKPPRNAAGACVPREQQHGEAGVSQQAGAEHQFERR